MKEFHTKSIEETMKLLNTSEKGLKETDISNRIKKYGKNELEEEVRESFLKKFLRQLDDIMVKILIVSGIISISIAIWHKQYSDLFEGVLILLICVFNALIGVIQEGKAENTLEKLKHDTISHIKVRRNNEYKMIQVNEITVGDIVCLESGDIVPADIRLIKSSDLMCDESCLTGESHSVEKEANTICEPRSVISKHKNMLYSKSIIVQGQGEGVVVSVGKHTEIGKIAQNINSTQKEETPIQKSLNKLNGSISIIILVICAIVYVIEVFVGKSSMIDAFLTSISLAVAAVPESLPAVTSIIMAMGVGRLSKQKAIVKRLPTIETLGCCQIICTDKTGTLTANKMEVSEIFMPKLQTIMVSKKSNNVEIEKILKCMIINNNAVKTFNEIIGDSTERALLICAENFGYNIEDLRLKIPNIYQIAFSSERKMMTTLVKEKFYTTYTKGSTENILKRCSYYYFGGNIEKLTQEKRKEFLHIASKMSSKSLRVLAFAYKEFSSKPEKADCEKDMIFLGLCGMYDPPRKEVYNAVQECFKAGLTPIMITGDSPETAYSIGEKLKICSSLEQVITGEELNKISESALMDRIDKYKIFARVNPEHKVKIVDCFQKKDKIVAMTGDGINDAPSLKKANIGVGMGSGTEVAKSASDMIITDDNFSTIVTAIKEGRIIFQNIKKTLQFLFSTNLVEVITIFITSLLFPKLEFLLPSQLLFINLVTDGLPAFSLGLEKAENNIMDLPPRKNANTIFEKKDIFSILIQAFYQVAILLTMYIVGISKLPLYTVITMCFFTFSIMQINHSINMKTSQSIFKTNLIDNKYFNFSFIFCISLNLILAFTPIGLMFSLVKLSLVQWIIVLIASLSIIPFVEIQKLVTSIKKK